MPSVWGSNFGDLALTSIDTDVENNPVTVIMHVNGQVKVPAGGQIKVPTPCGDS